MSALWSAKLLGGSMFELEVARTGRRYTISDEELTEMREVPEVFLSSGGRIQAGLARVTIDAPREIAVLRGENYRQGGKEASVRKVSCGSRWP